jgi:hypothetical protein
VVPADHTLYDVSELVKIAAGLKGRQIGSILANMENEGQLMTLSTLVEALKYAGCTTDLQLPGFAHLVIRYGDRKTIVPTHALDEQVGALLAEKLRTDLGLIQ